MILSRDRPLSLEFTPSRIGSSAWFLLVLGLVQLLVVRELVEGKASLARSASLDACPLALPANFVSGLSSGCVKLGASFWPSFSLLNLNLSTGVAHFPSLCLRKTATPFSRFFFS